MGNGSAVPADDRHPVAAERELPARRPSGATAVTNLDTMLGITIVAAAMGIGGVALIVVSLLGWQRRLPRNRFAGVRTVASLRDEETFAVANRVGAPLSAGAGAVAVLGGVATGIRSLATADAGMAGPVTVLVIAAIGTAALTVAGGVLGDRAARGVPVPTSACDGVCAGCSLVEGCSPKADQQSKADAPLAETHNGPAESRSETAKN